MTGWRQPLFAAALVEAACGLAAAAWINASDNGHQPVAVFVGCTLAAATADMVLVPGCVWVRRRVLLRLLCRALAAASTLVAAVWLAIWSMVPLFALGSVAIGTSFGNDTWNDVQTAMLAVPFLVAGTLAGLGAALADLVDAQPGIVRAQIRSHVAGGIAGVLLVLTLAIASGFGSGAQSQPDIWWPLTVLMPTVLVIGGGVRHALMARDAERTGAALAIPGRMVQTALACCGACTILAAAAAFALASLFD